MFKTVIFDLDGTLTDSFDGIVDAFNHALCIHHHSPQDRRRVRSLIGTPLEDMLTTLCPEMSKDVVEEVATTYREFYRTICGERSPLFPDTKRALDLLADRTLVCASTKITTLTKEILETQGIADRFQLIQGSEGIPKKPAPDLILKAMQLTGSQGNCTAMVGDTTLDVEAALGAGATPIGVLTGNGTGRELEAAGCCQIFPSLLASVEFIKSAD